MRRTLGFCLVALLGTVLAQAAAASDAQGSFQRALTVTGPVDLNVATGSGDVVVRRGSSGMVEIRGKIHVEVDGLSEAAADAKVHEIEANPPIEQSGNEIHIGHGEGHESSHGLSIDYELTVPPETRLRSQTGSGDVTVEGIHGPVEVESGSGDMKLSSIQDNVTVRTGSGDAKIDGIHAGRVSIATGSGDLELRDMHCALQAGTGSGDIQAEGEPTGRWEVHSGSGEVTLRLPDNLGFDLDARTESGDIHTRLPMIAAEGKLPNGELRGKVRGGGVPIEVRTESGDIHID